MRTVNKSRSTARRAVLEKTASLTTDVLATLPGHAAGAIPVFGPLLSAVHRTGEFAGMIATPKSDANPDTDELSTVPGVGTFRIGQRKRRVMDASNAAGRHGTANLVAEEVGGFTGPFVGAGLGALAGGALGSLNGSRRAGSRAASVGAVAGATLPILAGLVAAAIKRKRSKQEQIDSDTTGRAVAKYLVPGLAAYDSAKRLGASTHYDAKRKGDNGEKKTAEVAFYEGFRKAAEAAGVDPVALYKSAAPWGLLGKGINAIARFSRSSPTGQVAKGLQRGMNWFAGTRPGKAVARYGSLINGGGIAGYESQLSRFGDQMRRAHSAGDFRRWGRAMADYNQAAGLLANERNAVNLARNATLLGGGTVAGVAGGYGLGRMTGGSDDDSPDYGWVGHNFSGYGAT